MLSSSSTSEDEIPFITSSTSSTTKTAEERIEEVCQIPLFMKTLPKDIESNEALLGLQALLYSEGTPDELAHRLHQQAQTLLRQRPSNSDLERVLQLYTQTLQHPIQDALFQADLYYHRGHTSFQLQRYEPCLQDCLKALKFNPSHLGAIQLLAQCYGLHKDYTKALTYIRQGLSLQPEHPELLTSLTKYEKALKVTSSVTKKIEPWELALQQYGIPHFQSSVRPYLMFDTSSPVLEAHQLYLPCVILYPEFQQFDYLASLDIEATFFEALTPLFESTFPYDPSYTLSTIQVGVWTNETRSRVHWISSLNQEVRSMLSKYSGVFHGVIEFIVIHSSNEFAKSNMVHSWTA